MMMNKTMQFGTRPAGELPVEDTVWWRKTAHCWAR